MDDQNGESPRKIHLGYLVGLHYQSILPKEIIDAPFDTEFPPLMVKTSNKHSDSSAGTKSNEESKSSQDSKPTKDSDKKIDKADSKFFEIYDEEFPPLGQGSSQSKRQANNAFNKSPKKKQKCPSCTKEFIRVMNHINQSTCGKKLGEKKVKELKDTLQAESNRNSQKKFVAKKRMWIQKE